MALATYLRAKPLPLPSVVGASRVATSGPQGEVTASFERGALIVQHADGRAFRVTWEGVGDRGSQPRALPVGTYKVRGYRVLADDAAGVPWMLSSSGASLGVFTVAAGKTTAVPSDGTVRLVKQRRGQTVSVAVQGHAHAGLTVYRNGKRIPMGYRLVAEGKVVDEGPMAYG